MKSNEVARDGFFIKNSQFYDMIIDTIMKNPTLCQKAVDYVFDKESRKVEEETLKKKNEMMVSIK